MKANRQERTKQMLEELYSRYNRLELVKPDPLQFVHRYVNPPDMELAGFFAAGLAYGRVQQIEISVNRLLEIMSPSPYEFILNFNEHSRAKLADFRHRFTGGEDIADLCGVFREVLSEYPSLGDYFLKFYNDDDETILPSLSGFVRGLLDKYTRRTGNPPRRGMKYLLSDPADGSACKRLNLFLRWMVRKDDIDVGIWTGIDKGKLIVPVDVHIARLTRILGFHERNQADLKTGVEITDSFRRICPADPVKYDFALSRIGITENCTGKINDRCKHCKMLELCLERGK
jgi:uncharacterized protein (TIGR02757 family)